MLSPSSDGGRSERDREVTAEIASLLGDHDRHWAELDLDALAGLWDSAEPFPVYLGEEYGHPLTTWSEMSRHWARLGARLRSADVRSELTSVNVLAPALAAIVALVDWRFVGVESLTEHHGQSWATAIVRRRATAWRFVHYMEAPAMVEGRE
jgi:hypothetical protein